MQKMVNNVIIIITYNGPECDVCALPTGFLKKTIYFRLFRVPFVSVKYHHLKTGRSQEEEGEGKRMRTAVERRRGGGASTLRQYLLQPLHVLFHLAADVGGGLQPVAELL